MTTIKTMTLVIIMLFASNHAMSFLGEPMKGDVLPGDGKHKHNPEHKHGESLKGYFYRIYGDVNTVPAKDIEFKGPFKRKKMKKFLKNCQAQNGDIASLPPKVVKKEMYRVDNTLMLEDQDMATKIHHITLKSQFNCMVNGKKASQQKWAAVYLDRDEEDSKKNGIYIDYDYCNSGSRTHLSVGEYSIHYDDNHRCYADLNEISDD